MKSFMKEIEIKISHIDKLNMVHFFTLDDIEEKALALAVFYGNNGALNLCAFDEFFEMLVAKVLSVYSKLTPEERTLVYADDNTRQILEGASSLNSQTAIKDYCTKVTTNASDNTVPIASTGYIDSFLSPVIKYILEVLYQIFRVEYKSPLYSSDGWFGRGIYKYVINGCETFLPYRLSSFAPGRYTAVVNNFLRETNTLTISLNYESDRLIISFKDFALRITGLFTYDLVHKKDTLNVIESVKQDNKELVFVDYEIPSDSSNNLLARPEYADMASLLPRKAVNSKSFKLPWNQYINVNVSSPAENMSYEEYQVSYCYADSDIATILSFFDNRTNLDSEVTSAVSSSKMLIKLYKELNKKSFYASFDDAGYNSAGYYKKTLENKIFQFTDKE